MYIYIYCLIELVATIHVVLNGYDDDDDEDDDDDDDGRQNEQGKRQTHIQTVSGEILLVRLKLLANAKHDAPN